MTFPVPIGSFKIDPGQGYSFQGMQEVLEGVIPNYVGREDGCILLSAGVDSAVLAKIVLGINPFMMCLTIGADDLHPDLVAARRLCREWGFNWANWAPGPEHIQLAETALAEHRMEVFPGDVGVYLALKKARELGCDYVLAADGIDEQVGGYWWHGNASPHELKEVFTSFWGKLDLEHFGPMARSADLLGIKVRWPFMDSDVIEYISRIPLDVRVLSGQPKQWWKEFAKYLDIPDWIINRPKRGFVDALKGE